MAELEIRGASVALAAQTVLSDVHLHLRPGWYGLVGANGAGKTTLLRVLAGEVAPSGGSVRVRPGGAHITHCPQSAGECSADIEAFARSPCALHGTLALRPSDLARWPTLSPGERKRWQVGAALAQSPDVLLLDEPESYLDDEARALLTSALRRFRGLGVVVSHDRTLLDALTDATIRVHHARVAVYAGGYGDASRLWIAEREQALEAHDRAKRRVRALASRLDHARREQASADRARSTRSRMKGPRDHDARSALAKFRATSAEARAGRSVTVARSELDRAAADVPRVERDRTRGGSVRAPFTRGPGGAVFHVDEAELGVLRDVRVTVGREERVRVCGANGAGKSTLVRALVASRPEGTLYLPQELGQGAVAELLRDLGALDPQARGRVLAIVAALGTDPERISGRRSGHTLSPGEARKLALAFGLGAPRVSALVLDEPESHLDVPSIERLEAAIDAFPGCVVLVSHDERFAASLSRRELRIAHGRVM